MNIFITGGTGFIGSHLVEFLLKKNTTYMFLPNIVLNIQKGG